MGPLMLGGPLWGGVYRYSEFFWSVFSRIRGGCGVGWGGGLLRVSPCSVLVRGMRAGGLRVRTFRAVVDSRFWGGGGGGWALGCAPTQFWRFSDISQFSSISGYGLLGASYRLFGNSLSNSQT